MPAINSSTGDARLKTPGVYLQEVEAQAPAVFRTGVPAFVGFVQADNPPEEARSETCVALTRWEEFSRVGRSVPGGFLEYAVRGFFQNGGEHCLVVPLRVPGEEQDGGRLIGTLRSLFTKHTSRLWGVLEELEDADLICVPDLMMESVREDRETLFELQKQVLKYCDEMRDRFAILDVPPPVQSEGNSFAQADRETIQEAIRHWQKLPSPNGALYVPWIKDHVGGEGPPCGHVAGIYARTDAQIGVHKAPANEIVEGAVDLAVHLSEKNHSDLNEVGVNCLRSFPRRGIRVWGARTLSVFPNWRYVNVRRLFLTLVRWIDRNLNDLVLEPNNHALWERVRDRLGTYCYELFQRGALKGHTPAEAFFIKCDAETNPLEGREQGQVICEIGFAALAPAEFIIVRITKNIAGTEVAISTGG